MLVRSAIRTGAVLGLLAAGTLLAAQDVPKPQMRIMHMRGWIVDDKDSHKHANADSAEAVLKAYEEGIPLLFWGNDGTYYTIANQEDAVSFVGREWKVLGTLMPDDKFKIGTFIDPAGVDKPQIVGTNSKPPRLAEPPTSPVTPASPTLPGGVAERAAKTPPAEPEAAPAPTEADAQGEGQAGAAAPEKKDPPR